MLNTALIRTNAFASEKVNKTGDVVDEMKNGKKCLHWKSQFRVRRKEFVVFNDNNLSPRTIEHRWGGWHPRFWPTPNQRQFKQ